MVISEVERLAAFSVDGPGGNPAGVVVCDALPPPSRMQEIAVDIGFSETAFAASFDGAWRVRYFAPQMEVPFCGHATIALGAALADRHGNGVFQLQLNDTAITVEGRAGDAGLRAALHSPPTRSENVGASPLDRVLAVFGYRSVDLDPRLPPRVVEAGARHLALALSDRRQLAAMRYDLNEGRKLMLAHGLVTISLLHVEAPSRLHARFPFAAGGVYEDPATGAAAAALGRLSAGPRPHGGAIEIVQGEDMGVPCHLYALIPPKPGAGIRVSGDVRRMTANG